jgi:Fe-S-cluster containining protein
MGEPSPFVLACPCGQADGPSGSRWKTFTGQVSVWGHSVEFSLSAEDRPARLDEIVPAARQLATYLARDTVARAKKNGACIPCREACSACCRYLVPLSVPEAHRLMRDVQSLPAVRREGVLASFASAADHVLRGDPPDLPARGDASSAAGLWYARLDLPCPLLAEQCCTMYPQRPIACREHMVTSPPELCGGHRVERGSLLPPPVSVTEALGVLAAEMEGSPVEAVILPLAPAWSLANRHRADRVWPAPAMAERLVAILQSQANQEAALLRAPDAAA